MIDIDIYTRTCKHHHDTWTTSNHIPHQRSKVMSDMTREDITHNCWISACILPCCDDKRHRCVFEPFRNEKTTVDNIQIVQEIFSQRGNIVDTFLDFIAKSTQIEITIATQHELFRVWHHWIGIKKNEAFNPERDQIKHAVSDEKCLML